MPGRLVSLVVCDGEGRLLGRLQPFRVATPWWQEAESIQARHPGLAVLRLLQAFPDGGELMGGSVTYLAEALASVTGALPFGETEAAGPFGTEPLQALEPDDLNVLEPLLADDPLRMPWAYPGGPSADLEWALSIVEPAGPATQHRTWNLSSIWSIPVGEGRVWLKVVPGFFGHEAAVLEYFAGDGTPRLLGGAELDGGGQRLLLGELGGRDGYDAGPAERAGLLDRLLELQMRTVGGADRFLAAGVPDGRWPTLVPKLRAAVGEAASQDRRLAALVETMDDRIAEIESCGLPDVLVHGDAHAGNARIGIEPPIWFDWGDSLVGSPALDRRAVEGMSGVGSADLLDRWVAAWTQAVPGSDPRRAWQLARPLALLRQADVYQTFLDNIEPTERVYHRDDVAPCLQAAAEAYEDELT